MHTRYKCNSCNKQTNSARPIKGFIICTSCHYSFIASKILYVTQILKLKL